MTLKKLLTSLITSLTFTLLLSQAKPLLGAEKVVFGLSVLGEFTVSLDSLEKFEKTGEIAPDLALYTRYLDEPTLIQFRGMLQQRFPISPVVISNFTQVGIGETLLKRMGELIQQEGKINGFYALRSSLVLAAGEPEGVSLIGVLRRFPRQEVYLNTDEMMGLVKEFATLLDYTKVSMEAIAQETTLEAQAENLENLENLKDLRQSGQYKFQKQTITFEIAEIRQTNQGLSTHYPLEVDVYLPLNPEKPSPLIIISHGFGSYQGNYGIAEHLASYGFAVVVPRHIGSDLAYRDSFLQGKLRVILSPIEFVSRPLDITYLLNELEELAQTDVQWIRQVDLDKIGILGHSLGGSTALSLAGANFNRDRLAQDCEQKNQLLNFSLFLQCRAIYLPKQKYNLADSRIKAMVLAHPLGSSLFGSEEIEKIEIPTLVVGGSEDLVTPVMIEQVHPFIWLKTPQKYLSLMMPGTHFSSTLQSDTEGVEGLPEFLIGNNADLGTRYLKGVTVAFFEVYLHENPNYTPYLSASYHQSISEERLQLNMIRSLTPNQLEQAYEKALPLAIYPSSVETKSPTIVSRSIMEELEKTGVLKVALRGDAPPFGYINNQGEWTGYCEDFVVSLGQYLQTEYNISAKIEVIKIPSNIDNRFELVQQNQAYLECGPNTIKDNVSGVEFSNFFFLTGTQFLVKPDNSKSVNPFQSLAGIDIGVLENTTTEQFINQQYPDANITKLDAYHGRIGGIEGLNNNQIDALASDGILLTGEIERQALPPENYQLIPDKPLTCEYYGLILPNNDPQWLEIVNEFISSSTAQQIWTKWFKSDFSYVLNELDDCINR